MNDLESGSQDATPTNAAEEKAGDSTQTPADPNIVDWDGPVDPANPLNWSKSIRIGHVALISLITLVAYVVRCLSRGYD